MRASVQSDDARYSYGFILLIHLLFAVVAAGSWVRLPLPLPLDRRHRNDILIGGNERKRILYRLAVFRLDTIG